MIWFTANAVLMLASITLPILFVAGMAFGNQAMTNRQRNIFVGGLLVAYSLILGSALYIDINTFRNRGFSGLLFTNPVLSFLEAMPSRLAEPLKKAYLYFAEKIYDANNPNIAGIG